MGNRMANVVIYVMAKQNVEAKKDEVLLGEAASIYCENSAIRARASKLRIHKFREGQESRVVISMMKIIEMLTALEPGVTVESIGEKAIILEKIPEKKYNGHLVPWKIALVAAVSFFGTAFTIMAFHNDVGISDVFVRMYEIVTGEKYPEKITYNGSLYDTREYLASALESEMGASYSYEALKAQAIALYTFAKYNNYNLSEEAHAYGKTPSELCYRVVDDVMNTGYYIAYGNDVAVTPFHAMSAGVTTSYYNVWGKGIGTTVPYLAGGRKSYGDYLDSNYKSVYTITSDDMKAIAKEKLDVELTGDPANWLTIVTHDKAVREDIGYVSSMSVGGKIVTGYDFRIKVLEGKIRSHCFTIVYTPQS